jgi:hypothetical protein
MWWRWTNGVGDMNGMALHTCMRYKSRRNLWVTTLEDACTNREKIYIMWECLYLLPRDGWWYNGPDPIFIWNLVITIYLCYMDSSVLLVNGLVYSLMATTTTLDPWSLFMYDVLGLGVGLFCNYNNLDIFTISSSCYLNWKTTNV